MTTFSIPKALREQVRRVAKSRCEYCRTPDWLIGNEHEIDHIIARAHGGLTVFENVCYACSTCNGYKLDKAYGVDPDTGEKSAIFHPRTQRWGDHFAWDINNTRIIGLTVCGRATIDALHLNYPLMVIARSIWVTTGLHPPKETLT